MTKETISDKQGISLIIMFLIGTTTLTTFGLAAKESFWLSIILAITIEFFIVLIYTRLCYLFPQKDLFDIIEICFGKYLGKLIMILFTCFFFDNVSIVAINFSKVISTTTLLGTPEILTRIGIVFLAIVIVKNGLDVMGKWARFMIPLFIFSILLSLSLSTPNMNMTNILPILDVDLKSIFKGTFLTFVFPFGEIIVFTMVFHEFKTNKSPIKIYSAGLIISGILILMISFTNVLVQSVNFASKYYYPTYITFTKIHIGDFLKGIEVLLSVVFVLGSFIKISIYLLAISRGITKIFKYTDYRFIVVPIGLTILNFSLFYFDSVKNLWEYNDEIWSYYALLYEIIFPVIIIITAEIKKKKIPLNSLL